MSDAIETGQDLRPRITLYALVPMHMGYEKEVGIGDAFVTRDEAFATRLVNLGRASKEAPKKVVKEDPKKGEDSKKGDDKTNTPVPLKNDDSGAK